jgi:signal transduction histidine kinase/DNA-binding NarL/FixJ family response regulator
MRAPLRFFPLRRNRAALALLGALALACMIAAAAITAQVLIRLEAYGTADTDNLQWTISQLEVDQMRFGLALQRLDPADPGSPEAARRSFDLLYSRAMTLRTSPTYRDVLETEPTRADMRAIINLLGEMLPVIDSTDAAIVNGRARLIALSARMTAPIRALGFQAVAVDAHRAGTERAALTAQIVTLTALSLAMLLALVALLVLLWNLYRDRLAAEAEATVARERELRAVEARARFLAVISHEMRTPLNGLLGALELLQDSPLSPEQARFTRIMKASGAALRTHIDEALDGLQAEAGGIALRPAPFDLDELLKELIEGQRAAADRRGNRLVLAVPEGGMGHVTGDRQRLSQVLLNLLSNAIKFTSHGTVTLSADRFTGTCTAFRVSDTGIGIPSADLPHVFEDFVRLPPPDGVEREGSGLGLGIVRQLVTLMGGRIEVESRPGEGSRFTVRLALPEADLPDDLPAQIRPLRVLMVEDTPASRMVLGAMLARDGHEVILAHDGLDGVRKAGRAPVDLILMDLDMPRLDGIEATRRIRNEPGPNARTPIVALTAHYGAATAARLRAAGADTTETKPLSRERLRALLARLGRAQPLIDIAHVAQLSETLPAAQLDSLLDGLRAEATALLGLPEDAPTDGVRTCTHRFAGIAATSGAIALHAHLAGMEAALEAGDTEGLRVLRANLPALWQATDAALRPHRTAA